VRENGFLFHENYNMSRRLGSITFIIMPQADEDVKTVVVLQQWCSTL